MQLPGGLPAAKADPAADMTSMSYRQLLQRRFSFAPDTGLLSLALQDALQDSRERGWSHPHWVSQVLVKILASLGDPMSDRSAQTLDLDLERVRDLCIADRQYIFLQWRIRYGDPMQWLTARCDQCQASYDFPLDWRLLPIQPAAESFPYASAETSQGTLLLRVANGRDQEWLAQQEQYDFSAAELRRLLALRLIVGLPGGAEQDGADQHGSGQSAWQPDALTDDDLNVMEQALEAVAPELPMQLETVCPECGAPQCIALDLYAPLAQPATGLLDEIHQLALNYHWSEAEILKLPRQRRQQYLLRLERERGFSGA